MPAHGIKAPHTNEWRTCPGGRSTANRCGSSEKASSTDARTTHARQLRASWDSKREAHASPGVAKNNTQTREFALAPAHYQSGELGLVCVCVCQAASQPPPCTIVGVESNRVNGGDVRGQASKVRSFWARVGLPYLNRVCSTTVAVDWSRSELWGSSPSLARYCCSEEFAIS